MTPGPEFIEADDETASGGLSVRTVWISDLHLGCGHIHHAEMREIDGILYCNDGDWVESLTALVEHHDGRLEIIDRSPQAALARGHQHTAASTPLPEPVFGEAKTMLSR